MKYRILQGDNRETLKTLADNSIDAIVTDPPYGIDFLGKSWDANTGALETYQECLRVLKPGGHILAFSAARTYHHLAITLEQAGFEIRDQIMWIYSSGFPKSQDVGKSIQRSEKNTETNDWLGWGTSLKPAHEPICMARKPIKQSIAKNAQQWGTGALNIDAARIPYAGENDKPIPHGGKARQHKDTPGWMADNTGYGIIENPEINELGRFPSNVIGEITEPYQKYFYCPKVSRRERHKGFELPPPMFGGIQGCYDENGERFAVGFDARAEGKSKKKKHDPLAHIPTDSSGYQGSSNGGNYIEKKQQLSGVGNNHPTVKPVALMKYLIKLVTPPGGTVLDPFNGSGSTGMAAVELGHEYIGCELDPAYVEIANKRIEAWNTPEPTGTTFEALFEETK